MSLLFSCEQKKTKLIQTDLQGKSLAELRILRNEIFARHGYIFKSQDLSDHFSKTDWYSPEHSDVNHLLTEQDKSQVELILKQEALLKAVVTAKPKEKTELSLTKFKKDSVNEIQKEAVKKYLNDNKSKIVDDFNRFWKRDLGIKSYKFKILDQSIFSNSEEPMASVKLEVKGQGEKFSATAFNNYLLSINTSPTKVYETGFFQPECGTPDITIYSMFVLNILDKAYPTIELQSKKHPCCGQASEEQLDWLVFGNNFADSLATIEKYFHNDNLMDCGPANPPPAVTRKTDFYLTDGNLTTITLFLEGAKEIKSEERKISF